MTERATAYSISPQANHTTGNELAVRPKVLRRPAHFGTSHPPIEATIATLIPLHVEPAAPEKSLPAFRAWQDDGKFAIALLAFVILVNIVVSTWLAAIAPEKQPLASLSPVPVEATPAANTSVHELDHRAISEQ